MAMNIGTEGAGDPEVLVDINTTPLIDVMLVLLIMLIITIPIQLHSVTLNMPVPAPSRDVEKPEVVKLDIDEHSIVYWQGVPVVDRADMEARMRAAAQQQLQPEIHVRPNKLAKYKVVANVMASSHRIGLTKIGIVGGEQFVE